MTVKGNNIGKAISPGLRRGQRHNEYQLFLLLPGMEVAKSLDRVYFEAVLKSGSDTMYIQDFSIHRKFLYRCESRQA